MVEIALLGILFRMTNINDLLKKNTKLPFIICSVTQVQIWSRSAPTFSVSLEFHFEEFRKMLIDCNWKEFIACEITFFLTFCELMKAFWT